jgi:hypothetical protein
MNKVNSIACNLAEWDAVFAISIGETDGDKSPKHVTEI